MIWLKFRNNHVATPGAAKKLFLTALKTEGMTVDVVDLFIVPDYGLLLRGCITKLGKAFKNMRGDIGECNYAQLRWTFTAVEISEQFPLGCDTRYR